MDETIRNFAVEYRNGKFFFIIDGWTHTSKIPNDCTDEMLKWVETLNL